MKAAATPQKLRGGYYTPKIVADFLVRWAVERATDAVLEPSCGDGAFLESLVQRRAQLRASHGQGKIVAIELDPGEAALARAKLPATAETEVVATDFFAYCRDILFPGGLWEATAPRFEAVVGNPPFIRYQSFPDAHRNIAFSLMQRAGLRPNRLTNAWVPFLVCGAMSLADEGRLAMIIPAELLQVNYAAEVRRFLSDFFERITILTFRGLLFPEIQQEVVLLLAERRVGESHGIRTVELTGPDNLSRFDFFQSLNADIKELDHTKEKWTKYFLPHREIGLLRQLRANSNVYRVADFASVDVGVVTGENEFFVLRPSDVQALRLTEATTRVVSRSNQLAGLYLRDIDWRRLERENARVLLFFPAGRLSASARAYIVKGEEGGKNAGYKCRIRGVWYIVPSVWAPDAFALRQIHKYPKLVLNDAQATATDTLHRVRFHSGVDGPQIAAAFLNSMTFAFAEVMGRSYGGGVLTFEPSEVENLPIPIVGADQLDKTFIDQRLRDGDIYAVLDHTDDILLRQSLGLDRRDIASLRYSWEALRDRRTGRRTGTRQLDMLSSKQVAGALRDVPARDEKNRREPLSEGAA